MHPPVLRRGIPYNDYYTAARGRPGDRGTREVGRRRREIKKGKAWCCRGSGTSPCVAVLLMRAGRRLDAAISLPPPFAQTAQAQETAVRPGAPASALCSCAPAVNRALAAVNGGAKALSGAGPAALVLQAGRRSGGAVWGLIRRRRIARRGHRRANMAVHSVKADASCRVNHEQICGGDTAAALPRRAGLTLPAHVWRRPLADAVAGWGRAREGFSPLVRPPVWLGRLRGDRRAAVPGLGIRRRRGLCLRGCWPVEHGRMVDGVPPAPLLTLADGLQSGGRRPSIARA